MGGWNKLVFGRGWNYTDSVSEQLDVSDLLGKGNGALLIWTQNDVIFIVFNLFFYEAFGIENKWTNNFWLSFFLFFLCYFFNSFGILPDIFLLHFGSLLEINNDGEIVLGWIFLHGFGLLGVDGGSFGFVFCLFVFFCCLIHKIKNI